MDKATKVAVEKYPHGTFDGEIGDGLRAACAVGYMQAERDLALTLEDIVRLNLLIMGMEAEGYNDGYKTRPFYEEVLRRFNDQYRKK